MIIERNALLKYVHPHLQDSNRISCSGFEALFGTRSAQKQEQILADLAS